MTYMLCDDFNSTYSNKLGIYLLRLGYEAGDNYAIIPFAQLYAQGRYVPQNIEYAEKILTSSMSEYKARKLIQIWINDIK
jgi:TPR repeat protein